MKRFFRLILFLALAACRKREPSPEIAMAPSHAEAQAPPSGAVSGSTVTVARVSFEAPARWVRETPSSSMRAAQFSIPGSGNEKNASFVVYYFGKEQGGGAAENVERWRGQFTASNGGKAAAQTQSRSISGLRVTTVTAEGTFEAGMPMGPASPEPNSALWGAIVEGPTGNVFLKATGPRATVNAARAELEKALASIHPAP
jgi:hypothetical protein